MIAIIILACYLVIGLALFGYIVFNERPENVKETMTLLLLSLIWILVVPVFLFLWAITRNDENLYK